jgi:proton-translocating NADH-quinone oxidoreductase chain L
MSFLCGSCLGKLLGKGVVYLITIYSFLVFLISIFVFYNITSSGAIYSLSICKWINLNSIDILWTFYFDSITAVMLVVITLISFLVHFYSIEYMAFDPHLSRFMSYLSLFTLFMIILVTGGNFLQMFVGWEGVGLSSYLLINFWFTRIQANKSAIKAMLVNRVGDFFILISIFILAATFKSLDYLSVFTSVPLFKNFMLNFLGIFISPIDLICFCLLLGSMGKSAQLGLHTWLPDAMEGPTPVSALIHAATMVTAGIFLIVRCSFIFEYSPLVLEITMIIGSLTAFFAATVGLMQNDIKKVIAYSTCSQLGYMFFACGMSGYNVGIFHLANHAFFKALLFLSAGSIIHSISDEQDLRKMGGLKNVIPFSYSCIIIGSLALSGFPFFAGFYSKDTILEISYSNFSLTGHFCFYLGTMAAFFTAFYSMRIIFLVFLSNSNGNRYVITSAHESKINIMLPLFILSIMSLIIGYVTKDLFIGLGTNFWNSSIFISPSNYLLSDIEFISLSFKLFPFFFTLIGTFIAFYAYSLNIKYYYRLKKTNFFFKEVYNFLNKKWYFDRLYNQYISISLLNFGFLFSYKIIDRGLLESFGPFNVTYLIKNVHFIKLYQSGDILDYVYIGLFSILYIVTLYIYIY